MSRPNSTANHIMQSTMKKNTNQPAMVKPNLTSKINHQSVKNKEAPVKSNELALKVFSLPLPPTQTKNNCHGINEKTVGNIQVSHGGSLPVKHNPESVQSNAKTPPLNDATDSKLQMISENIKEANISNKDLSATNSQTLEKPSSMPLLIEYSAITVHSAPNSNLSNKASKNVASKMNVAPPLMRKNFSVDILKNDMSQIKKQYQKTVIDSPKIPDPGVQTKQTSKEKQPNKSSHTASMIKEKYETERKNEFDDRKKQSAKTTQARATDPEDDSPRIESTYIADGLREDCDNLIEKCLQVYKLNFEKFTEIWKQMKFPRIFHERQSSPEIAELSEEVLHVAKVHMVAKNVNYEENVAGLFLVYALLNHQPYKGFAALRLVPSDVPAILRLETEARKQRRHDVLYILGNVLIKGPCQFHVLAREVALEVPIRKYFDGSVQVLGPNTDSVFSRTAECVHHFKDLIGIDQRYLAIRQKIKDRHGGVDRVRNLGTQPAADLFAMYKSHIPGGMAYERDARGALLKSKSLDPKEDRQDLVKSIKVKAMTNVVDPMKHLTGIEERHEKTLNSSSEKCKSEAETNPSCRYKGKGKGKGKGMGRSSAQTLQELFSNMDEKPVEEEAPPQPSKKAMPILNLTEDLIITQESTPTHRRKKSQSARVDKGMQKRTNSEENDPKNGSVSCSNEERNWGKADKNEFKTKKRLYKKIQNKTKRKQGDQFLSDSDFDSDEIDKIPVGMFPRENTVAMLDSKKYSHNQELEFIKNVSTDKNNAKDKNINVSKLNKQLPNEREINIQLGSLPIEIHKVSDNIELEIIDNFKGDETTKGNVSAVFKKYSTKNKISEPNTREGPTPASNTNKLMDMVNTDQINARFLRKKRKELKRKEIMQKNYTGQLLIQNLESEDSNKSEESVTNQEFDADMSDTSLPSVEEIEARMKKRGRRNYKRSHIRSAFKKLGILEVADLDH